MNIYTSQFSIKMHHSTFCCILWIIFVVAPGATVEGAVEEWCVADPQAPENMLQGALNWACGVGGADCSPIQPNQACYLPDTLAFHASVAFNIYWQKFKSEGASCYFDAAAMVTENNPSQGSCVFGVSPGSGILNKTFDNGPTTFGPPPFISTAPGLSFCNAMSLFMAPILCMLLVFLL